MNDKVKKAIRERMARTGEAYTTARMHVLGRNGRFAAVVEGIIRAAQHEGATSPSGPTTLPVRRLAAVDSKLGGSRLQDRLAALDDDDLRKVEVLFYAGRDLGVDVIELAADLGRDLPRATAAHLVERTPVLAEYLRAGLQAADRQGVNLDVGWPSPAIVGAGWYRLRPFRAIFERLPGEPVAIVEGSIEPDAIALTLDGALVGRLEGRDGGRDRAGAWIAVEAGEAELDSEVPVRIRASVDGFERAVDGVEIHLALGTVAERVATLTLTFDLDGAWTGGGLPARKLRPDQVATFLARQS